MKISRTSRTSRIVGLVLVLIATFAAARTTPASAAPGGSLECARFCMVALCPSPQTCGLHQTPTGLRCGCF
jgi:hypothetical protein